MQATESIVKDATRGSLVQQMVTQVEPALRSTAATSEAERRLAPAAMDALIDAGIPRAFLPAQYHGAELSAVYGVKLFEQLATIDSAAAWVGMISAAGAWLTVVLPPAAADEMFADPRAVINGSLFPPLSATPAQGGYRVTGRSAFGSGCEYATWLGCQAVVMENGAPKLGANGTPMALLLNFPASEAQIISNWNTLGMCGTGSHDFRVDDIFVPEHRAWPIGPYAPMNPAFSDAQSRMGLWWFSPVVASVSLGIARAAVDALVE